MITVGEDIDVVAWRELMNDSSTANFFQSKECFDFYSSLSFFEAFALGVTEDGVLRGVIVGYIQREGGRLKQFFSKRAIITGGALLADDISEDALSQLLIYCRKRLSRKAIYIELRNFNDYGIHKKVFQKSGFSYVLHLNFHVDCSSEDVVNRNIGKSTRRNIKTSLREGVGYLENPTLDDVRSFYSILNKLYVTKVKTSLLPFSFFEELYKHSFARFHLVVLNDKIIGGAVNVVSEKGVMYEWFTCGLNGCYKHIYPSTLAIYQAIIEAFHAGCYCYDMMGAGKPDEKYGVRDFKAQFGGKLVEHGRFLCVLNPVLYNIGKIGIKIIKIIK